MKINILSDLHLSLGALPVPRNDADLVVLAGDITRPPEAFAWAAQLQKPVLYVPGNHEYYGGSIDGVGAQLAALSAGSDIHVLDEASTVIGGVRFLGCTLWTDFMLFGGGEGRATAMAAANRYMRDFSRIRRSEGAPDLYTPTDCAALHARHRAWLERELASPHDGPTVVITHHAPSTHSIHSRFAGSLLNACFVSPAERLLDRRRAVLWIHGHTHDSFDYVCHGTRVVCNPRGYVQDGVPENAAFDPDLIVEVA